jgi:glycosyltransferase involved in cell wall biosynthesis
MPQAATDSSAPPYFLAVGRLEKLKGIHTLLPVFSEYPDAELWIAGEGGYEKRLKQLAAANPRIRFLGQRSQIELASLYRNAIALLVPSLCYEVFGLVVLEGFAQSTPAIVRGIGALAEVIQDSGGGLLYSSQAELRSAMSRLQGNREERNALGTAGNQALARYWSEETHVSRYLEIIASLYHKKRGRR